MEDVPQKFRTVGIVQLVAGLVNLVIGWWIASFGWSIVGGIAGTVCSTLTMFMCPLTWMLYFCGFLGFLVIPVAIVEILVGVLTLANPGSVKGVVPYVGMLQIPLFLLGDFISPIAGIVSIMMTKDPEVAGYIQG